ncbi:MAG: hypothetical protein ACM3ML_20715 [Micromonosporaceae bacterium]
MLTPEPTLKTNPGRLSRPALANMAATLDIVSGGAILRRAHH